MTVSKIIVYSGDPSQQIFFFSVWEKIKQSSQSMIAFNAVSLYNFKSKDLNANKTKQHTRRWGYHFIFVYIKFSFFNYETQILRSWAILYFFFKMAWSFIALFSSLLSLCYLFFITGETQGSRQWHFPSSAYKITTGNPNSSPTQKAINSDQKHSQCRKSMAALASRPDLKQYIQHEIVDRGPAAL